jgi:hypothetical protein
LNLCKKSKDFFNWYPDLPNYPDNSVNPDTKNIFFLVPACPGWGKNVQISPVMGTNSYESQCSVGTLSKSFFDRPNERSFVMKNNVFLKALLLVSLACIVGNSSAQTISEGTCTISKTFYKNDGTPLQGVRVIVTKVVKNGRIINRGSVTYLSDASGVVSFKVPQGSKVYVDPFGFKTPSGVAVNIPDSSGWTYTLDSPQPLGSMRAAALIVQRNDITVGTTHDTLDFSTTFNVSASSGAEARISINHDSLKARPGSKLNYLHDLFVDRGLSAHDETSLANAHTKALDSNFVLLIPPDYSAAAMTFTNRDSALRLINYATINITENDTIPAGASIVMAGKGRFNISSGKTLTFASGSRFDGGLQRRFIGSGTVKFQEDVVEAAYPQWWGAVGDSSTQCVAAFQSAVNSGVKRITVKVLDGDYLFNDDLTIPSNVSLTGKGRFNIPDTVTLTFASGSRFDGGLERRFIGSGTVKFQEDVVEAVYPQWWGALGDSSTQCVSAFQSAVNSGVKRITVKVPAGGYLFNDKLTIPSNVSLIGDNARIFSSDTSDHIFYVAPSKRNIRIIGFEAKYLPEPKVRVKSPHPNISAFFINECDTLEIAHCIVRNSPLMGMQLIAVRNAKIHHNHVEYTNADGIHVTNGLNSDTGRQLRSENVIITNNTVRNNGDDKIAVVSYERPFKAGHDSCEAGHTHKGCPPWDGAQLINRNIVIANNIVEGSNDRLSTIVNDTAFTRGITVLGGEKVVIDGNTIRGVSSGQTSGSMTRGILISNAPSSWCYRPVDIVVSNNIITDAGAVIDEDDIHAGIGIDGADSVSVIGNRINWAGTTAGIRVRGSTQNENFGAGYINNVKNVMIAGNTIQDSQRGLVIFTNSTNLHENITVTGNTISNTRRQFVKVDGAKNLYLLNNTFLNVNAENVSNLSAVQIDSVDNDLIVRGNVLRSDATNPTKNAVEVIGVRSNLNFIEKDNVFELTAPSGYVSFPSSAKKYASQAYARVHYGSYGTSAPTTGTWAVGDVAINNDPGSGEIAYWICTNADSPATWAASTAVINGISVNDTTGYVLTQAGVATITGVSHVRLDSYAAAALDTVTQLNGRTGQLVMVSSRNANHDIVLIDDDNKLDLNQKYVRLHSPKDVLFLLAYSANQWKQVGYFAGNTRQNRFSVDDTVGVVLSAAGTATVEGIGNLILDTFGDAALDTVTTLNGAAGQYVMISSRNSSHNLVFLDGTNFNLDRASIRLRSSEDVAVFKATSATSWKLMAFSGNSQNEKFTVDDTTAFVLTAAGTATITGVGNVILDTYGAATLDTVTTLTGNVGQVACISSRNGNHDLVFLDGTNFRLDRASIRLRSSEDVAVFKATSTTSWKLMAFSGNGLNEKFTVDDTTGFVLDAAGTATITGVGNVILDTYGGATLDTVTTLTGNVGQVAYISSRNDSRDLVFQDGTNFKLSQGTLRLQTKDDVLLLKATAASSWKQIALFGGNTRNTQFSLGDTTGFVLSASGADTVSGFGNVILDTYGGAALDTAVTLTANIGQIIYISTRNSSHDIRFLDSGNFKLGAERLLDHVNDVLALIAITATTFKELFFANNN